MNFHSPLFTFLLLVVVAPSEPSDRFLSDVNQLRRQYALEYNVSDMHELIWSNELVEILKPLDWYRAWPEARKTWRYMYFNSSVIPTKDIEGQLILFFAKTQSQQKEYIENSKEVLERSAGALELLNPHQKFFGCGPKTEGDSKLTVCLMGPSGDFKLFDTSGQSPERFLEDVNGVRRTYANQFNVSNMHELIWNENLVNTAKALDLNAHKWSEARITWRYLFIKTYNTSSKYIEKEIEEEFLKLNETEKQSYIDKYVGSSLGKPELLNPHHRFMGCAQRIGKILCLLGTEGGLTLFDTSLESNAKPGSQCYRNYENVNGLCVATKQEKLTIRINQIREKYAKLYNVPNMHQLIWSEDLLKFSNDGNFMIDPPQMGKTMRHVYLPKFEYEEYFDFFIESRIENNFISKDPIERNSFFASNVQTSLGDLELLIPLQKSIACEYMRIERDKKEYVCVIGPSGKPKMFNVDTASVTTHVAASNCSARYKSLDGLCVPENPTDVSYFGNSSDFLNDTWKESLVTLASSLNCSGNLTCANKTWRYTTDMVYTGITEKIDEEVDYYLTEMSQDEFLEFLKSGETHHVGHLELLNPMQTSIGCVEKLLWDFTVFCLLGDEGNFKMWDLKNVESKAGSSCAPGYENDDGLCSIPEAKSIVETTTEESTTGASTTSSAPKKSNVETTTKESTTEETTTEESTTGVSTTSSAPSKRRLLPKSSKKHSARNNKKTGGK
ncbi:hypothetical protein GCK72_007576 [Caenorhabditis remanei]|uniref:Uncharacterized protein n=1 Tax=Caenorhabditis remanei TaxID=31234 RepID=A0A6A5HMH2_CAERE|nr:hypothetical protein GCK72_007576 [Caenorhabditis remanei]KAF1767617.1 hypothetical protein GCK72_007576 [Caenorhabditis remanei]